MPAGFKAMILVRPLALLVLPGIAFLILGLNPNMLAFFLGKGLVDRARVDMLRSWKHSGYRRITSFDAPVAQGDSVLKVKPDC